METWKQVLNPVYEGQLGVLKLCVYKQNKSQFFTENKLQIWASQC